MFVCDAVCLHMIVYVRTCLSVCVCVCTRQDVFCIDVRAGMCLLRPSHFVEWVYMFVM